MCGSGFQCEAMLHPALLRTLTTGRRGSMTVQQAAASTALILGTERRGNGRWKRDSVPITESGNSGFRNRVNECGLVLDELGAATLEAVRYGWAPTPAPDTADAGAQCGGKRNQTAAVFGWLLFAAAAARAGGQPRHAVCVHD